MNVLVLVLFLFGSGFHQTHCQRLQRGFYSSSCPDAESIVSQVVKEGTDSDPTLPAALLRLHFHDCFVDGCDGSILIDTSSGNDERHASAHQGVRGFDIVETAKSRLEDACPGVVSCADIVALMARDSVSISRGPKYEVLTGRRDGLVSNSDDASEMPSVDDSVETLTDKFKKKGLSQRDLVLLTGAHTIGKAACFFITDRLYESNAPDLRIVPHFVPELMSMCPKNGVNSVKVSMDRGSDRRFDSQFYANVRGGFGIIKSDAALYGDSNTAEMVENYADNEDSFRNDFVGSILRMGNAGVNTGNSGEIRTTCSSFN